MTSAAMAALLLAFLVHHPVAQAAEPAAATAKAQPRYTLQSGRGWAVCEANLKFLNATPASEDPPLCDMKFKRIAGMREPDWEELDVAANLPVVHQIELLLGIGHIEPAPLRDFDLWKEQVRQRIKDQDQTPRLRRTRLAMLPGGPVETLLSYDQDANLCRKEVGSLKTGGQYRNKLGEPNFFIFDEAQQRVLGGDFWVVHGAGTLWLYLDKPYYFNLYVGGGIDPLKVVNAGTLDGTLFVKRLEPALRSKYYESVFPNEPPYRDHELCAIQFNYPIARIRN